MSKCVCACASLLSARLKKAIFIFLGWAQKITVQKFPLLQ